MFDFNDDAKGEYRRVEVLMGRKRLVSLVGVRDLTLPPAGFGRYQAHQFRAAIDIISALALCVAATGASALFKASRLLL